MPERFELGTLPYELLAGTTAAVDVIASLGEGATRRERLVAAMTAVEAHEDRLRARIEEGLARLDGVEVLSRAAHRTPTLLVRVPGGERRAYELLAERGVRAGRVLLRDRGVPAPGARRHRGAADRARALLRRRGRRSAARARWSRCAGPHPAEARQGVAQARGRDHGRAAVVVGESVQARREDVEVDGETVTLDRERMIVLYRRWLADRPELVEKARDELAGHDLACWCRPRTSATRTCCFGWQPVGCRSPLRQTSGGSGGRCAGMSPHLRRPGVAAGVVLVALLAVLDILSPWVFPPPPGAPEFANTLSVIFGVVVLVALGVWVATSIRAAMWVVVVIRVIGGCSRSSRSPTP